MPELTIEREHTLGLAGARVVAERWREQAEQETGVGEGAVIGREHGAYAYAGDVVGLHRGTHRTCSHQRRAPRASKCVRGGGSAKHVASAEQQADPQL